MADPIQGVGNAIQSGLRPPGSMADGKKDKAVENRPVDFRVSFQKEVIETITYDHTAKITAQPLSDSPEFSELLGRLLERQGITYEEAMGGKPVPIDPETRAEAQALISEDGYWGVNKTSERIFQFAVSGAGGDVSKLEEIKTAIGKGFELAKEALGGTLPEISTQTYDAIMEKLDDWAETETA